MMIQLHGGNCCGAKHIRRLGDYPDSILSARKPLSGEETTFSPAYGASLDMRTSHPTNSDADFFNAKAPKESAAARLRRFIRFLKKHRPHHMVDIILTQGQVVRWHKTIIKIGFVAGPTWKNSNTTRTLQVFYLVY
jgi:hypothetical protein